MHIKLNRNHSICFCLLIFFSVSCTNQNGDTRQNALKLAGTNKKELKKVLNHYKKDPADSLKYKAACFLIENMPWHFGTKVNPSEQLWDLFVLEDSLIRPLLREPGNYKFDYALYGYKYGAKKMLIDKAFKNSVFKAEYISDLLLLDASFIIENIDAAFSVKERDWCRQLSFEEFCEFVLPYRFNTEPVYPVRSKLSSFLSGLYLSDSLKSKGWQSISFLNNLVSHFNWDWDDPSSYPSMGFYSIFLWHQEDFTCSEHIAVLGPMMRSVGLPVAEVFTPKWRDSNLRHSWCAIPSGDRLTLFSAVYQNPGEVYLPHSPSMATKLYLRTYASNPESPYFLKMENEQLPPSFETPCIRDVTAEFVPVADVEINLTKEVTGKNLCWFSVFIQGNWVPVGWGVVNKKSKSVLFKDIPVGLTGLACSFENGLATPCSELFTVTCEGIKTIWPDGNTTTLTLTRKFPVKTRMQYFTGEIIGTKIQGAHVADFSDSVTLYAINDTLQPYMQDISFSNTKRYRYYRLYAPSWGLHIAELEFLTEEPSGKTVNATPLPVFSKNQPEQKNTYKYTGTIVAQNPDSTVFDGNMLTWSGEKWVGLDLGAPQNIKRIRIAPRNANNGIVAGDNYELYYWNNGWLPAGHRQAQYNYIEFENVPSNTLYWLRNLDHGKEEQPFFYVEDKQVFSNQVGDY